MDFVTVFMITTTIFRLAIIIAGIISIILGYRLFQNGFVNISDSKQETSFNAEIGKSTFSLKNAAPGTFFALFGVLLISFIFVQGSPEFTLELIDRFQKTNVEQEDIQQQMTVRVKNVGEIDLKTIIQNGFHYEQNGNIDKAIASYKYALNIISLPMNQLSLFYFSKGEIEKALELSALSIRFSPDNADYSDTLADILLKLGEVDEAKKYREKAAKLNPKKYMKKFLQFNNSVLKK